MRTVALICLLASPALAQKDCQAPDPTTAEVNSREGVRLAKAGQFEQAIALFRIAIRLDPCAPDHQLLLARALARVEQRDESRTLYNQVIENYPETPEAKRAETELAELDATPEPPPPMPPKTPTDGPKDLVGAAPVTPPPSGPPWDIIGYSAAGVGALCIGAGVFFALDAQQADDDLKTASTGTDKARYDELVDQRDSSSTLAYVMYGVGGALVVGGVAAALLLPTTASQSGETGVTAGADAAGNTYIGLHGTF